MRKYKFRGLSINNEWHYGLLSVSSGARDLPEKGYYISNAYGMPWAYRVRPETVGQFTHMKDKNGRGQEIYEGDLIGTPNGIVLEVVYKKFLCLSF